MAADVESVSRRPRGGALRQGYHKVKYTKTPATWHAELRRLWSRPVKIFLKSDVQ